MLLIIDCITQHVVVHYLIIETTTEVSMIRKSFEVTKEIDLLHMCTGWIVFNMSGKNAITWPDFGILRSSLTQDKGETAVRLTTQNRHLIICPPKNFEERSRIFINCYCPIYLLWWHVVVFVIFVYDNDWGLKGGIRRKIFGTVTSFYK